MTEPHALDALFFGDRFELFDILLDNAVHALCLIERLEHATLIERHHRFDVEQRCRVDLFGRKATTREQVIERAARDEEAGMGARIFDRLCALLCACSRIAHLAREQGKQTLARTGIERIDDLDRHLDLVCS